MDFAGYKYYHFTKTLLTLLGVWPFQKLTWLVRGERLFLSMTFIDSVIFQLTTCITHKCDIDLLLKLSAYVSIVTVFAVKYITFCVVDDKMKVVLKQIEHDWNALKDEDELKIMINGAKVARIVTIILGFMLAAASSYLIIFHISPYVLDVIAPLNESRPHTFPCNVEVFLDQEQFYTLIMLHIDLITLLGSVVILSTEAILILMSYHACGLILITSHRVKTLDDGPTKWSVENIQITHRKVVNIVRMHIRSNEFIGQLMSTLGMSYFVLAFVGVFTVTASLFRLRQAIILMNDYGELAVSFMHVLLDFCYMFFCNYCGQQVINYNVEVFRNIYNDVQWYEAPIFIRKLLLIIMERAIQDTGFTAGGIFTASYTCFIMLSKMSISYFMVISSLVQ